LSDADKRSAQLLTARGGFPSVQATLEWLEERLANCLRIAETKSGAEQDGWLEDAMYCAKTLAMIRALASGPRATDPAVH
jgi:hypothetical protein